MKLSFEAIRAFAGLYSLPKSLDLAVGSLGHEGVRNCMLLSAIHGQQSSVWWHLVTSRAEVDPVSHSSPEESMKEMK